MLWYMKTMLTVEDDVASDLEQLRQVRKVSLEELINEALRLGLKEMTSPGNRQNIRTRVVSLGGLRIASVDNIADVIATAEGEDFK
jgi:hypothetical protein